MRIVVANPSYPPMPCGIGEYSARLAQALSADHDVTALTSTAVPPRPGVLPLLADWAVLDFVRAARRIPRPDLVVCGYPSVLPGPHARLLYLLPALAKLLLGRPRVTFVVHEFVRTDETARRLLAAALYAADDIVAVTEAERAAVAGRYPRVARKLRVVENASSIPPVDASPEELAALRDDAPVVLFAGRLTSADKGFEELVEAVAGTGAVLAATGRLNPSDPLHARVAAAVERHGVSARWLGHLDGDDLARRLQAADVVALPFRDGSESGYTSLLGALVNGAAVVTTRGPNTPAWLRDGESVLLVPPRDPAALAAAIRRVLGDPALAARLRAGARALAPRFGWDRVAREIAA